MDIQMSSPEDVQRPLLRSPQRPRAQPASASSPPAPSATTSPPASSPNPPLPLLLLLLILPLFHEFILGILFLLLLLAPLVRYIRPAAVRGVRRAVIQGRQAAIEETPLPYRSVRFSFVHTEQASTEAMAMPPGDRGDQSDQNRRPFNQWPGSIVHTPGGRYTPAPLHILPGVWAQNRMDQIPRVRTYILAQMQPIVAPQIPPQFPPQQPSELMNTAVRGASHPPVPPDISPELWAERVTTVSRDEGIISVPLAYGSSESALEFTPQTLVRNTSELTDWIAPGEHHRPGIRYSVRPQGLRESTATHNFHQMSEHPELYTDSESRPAVSRQTAPQGVGEQMDWIVYDRQLPRYRQHPIAPHASSLPTATRNDYPILESAPAVLDPAFSEVSMNILAPSPPQCLICCESLEGKTVLTPCPGCHNKYCSDCVKDMFLHACQNRSHMPPKCCMLIPFHLAKPFLTKVQADEFRLKYQEWDTPNPMYCSVPSCSAFLSNRLIRKAKQHNSSSTGTFSAPTVACPKCSARTCIKCRQPPHGNTPCNETDTAVEDATLAVIFSLGFKRCPKCGTGVRKMFGCNHMKCLCGADWCWNCELSTARCLHNGGCELDEDEETEYNGDTGSGDDDSLSYTNAVEQSGNRISYDTQAPAQSRNLDGRSQQYWMDSGLNFGEEPEDEGWDADWVCSHEFIHVKVSVEEKARLDKAGPAGAMECSKCFKEVLPKVDVPNKKINDIKAEDAIVDGLHQRHNRQLRLSVGQPHLPTGPSPSSFPTPVSNARQTSFVARASPSLVQTDGGGRNMEKGGDSEDKVLRPFLHWSASFPSSAVSILGAEIFSGAYMCKECDIIVCSACKEELEGGQGIEK
ncbi:hypothetical protein GQ43DRAFT_490072 [Delitschia confertaspora ATCC 74209]|uniref:RBR-type E3 ubiquitin transferase n=1 Tax=Delitschia confertaspora ATCC 74209 TaxID=1513339 RepID=A0A9P4JN06_9PLEO|nr:hypothetical protein GQ43DRAFT_490072 [Delitschia confertaspora ATCC 74209]